MTTDPPALLASSCIPASVTRQEADLRLDRQLGLWQKAEDEYKVAKAELQYCMEVHQSLLRWHENLTKGMGSKWSSGRKKQKDLLERMSREAVDRGGLALQHQSNLRDGKHVKRDDGSQGEYLVEVLGQTDKIREEEEIAQLERKLASLYNRVGEKLEEDLIGEKVLSRIKKEGQRVGKRRALEEVEKVVGKYRNWQSETNKQVVTAATEKEVEKKVVNNLELMKLLMVRKVESNDFVFEEIVSQRSSLSQKVKRLPKLVEKVKADFEAGLTALKERAVVEWKGRKKATETAQIPRISMAQVESFFREAEQAVLGGDRQGQDEEWEVEQWCLRLEREVDSLQQR